MRIQDLSCCGLKELTGLSDHGNPKEALTALGFEVSDYGWDDDSYRKDDIDFSHAVFTCALRRREGVTKTNYGKRFANLIEKEGLGSVAASTTGTNPNSGNRLTVYVWTVNRTALAAWWKRNCK